MTRRINQYRLEDHTLERGCLHGMQVALASLHRCGRKQSARQ